MQMGVYIMELTEKKEFDLLSLGEIMLRLSPPDNERITRGDSFSKQAGGAELNAITGAAMLGLRCGIISKLPANDLGVYIKNRVRLCGVSDDYLVYDDDKDARLGVYYYENGAYPRKPRIVYDRKNTSINKLTVDDYDDKIYSDTRCFHTYGNPQIIVHKILPFFRRRQLFPLFFLPDMVFLFQIAVSLPFLESSD